MVTRYDAQYDVQSYLNAVAEAKKPKPQKDKVSKTKNEKIKNAT
jgi:hypothetical protein